MLGSVQGVVVHAIRDTVGSSSIGKLMITKERRTTPTITVVGGTDNGR